MSAQRYDVREVLEKYVATLGKPGEGMIRDAAELVHPKDIVRFALQHCIKTIEDAGQRDFLRSAYLSLGNFQELSEEERKALALLAKIGTLGSPGSDLHEEQAKRISEVAGPLQGLIDRVRTEAAVLAQELECLPGPPEKAPSEQQASRPHSAAAMPPSTASSAPVT